MKRIVLVCLALFGVTGSKTTLLAQDAAPGAGPGWTGLTNPADVIAARTELMIALEDLMRPIDTYTVEAQQDPTVLTGAAATIASMLLAVPHLFPPTTDRYDPDAEIPETLALPRIWEEFSAFYAMAMAASTTASTMAETRDADQLRSASVSLRASCDACHERYLRPYVRSEVTPEDLDFDFDSLFPED